MRKHWPVFYLLSLFLFIVFASVAQIIVNLVGNLGFHQFARSAAGKTWGSLFAEIIALLIWWLFNRYYLKAKIGWHGKGRDWLLILPVIVILIGDSFLGTNFNFAPGNIIHAVLFGLAVGACEEYLFRGILVSYLLQHFRLSALLTACLSGVGFGLIHLINGFSSGNWTNTFAQALMAIGVGFFLAAVYLLTNNLWLPIIFHAVVDAFDQLAFGTLSNSAGTSMINGIIYFIILGGLGFWLLNRGPIVMAQSVDFSSPSQQPQRDITFSEPTTAVTVNPLKSALGVALILIEFILGSTIVHPGQSQLVKTMIVFLLGLLVMLGAIWLYHDVLAANWRAYRRHFWRNVVMDFGFMIGVYILLAIVRLGLKLITGSHTALGVTDMLSFQSVGSASLTLISSSVVIMAPFTEEIIFRHVLFYQWRSKKWLAIIMFFVSSIAFGLVHWNNFQGDIMQMIPYMFIGAFFATIYCFTRNIWQNIITHFMFNFLQFGAAIFLLIVAIIQR